MMYSYLVDITNKRLNLSISKKITKLIVILTVLLFIIYIINCINSNNNFKIKYINEL
jgi:hypothetical protein